MLRIDPVTGDLLGPDPVTGKARNTFPVNSWSVGDRMLFDSGNMRAVIDLRGTDAKDIIERACTEGYTFNLGGRQVTFRARFATSALKRGQLTLVTGWDDRLIPSPGKSIYSGSLFSPARYGVEKRIVVLEGESDDSPDMGDGQAIFDEEVGLKFQTQYRLGFDLTQWTGKGNPPISKGTALGEDFLSITRPVSVGERPWDSAQKPRLRIKAGQGAIKCAPVKPGERVEGVAYIGYTEIAETSSHWGFNNQYGQWWPKRLTDKLEAQWPVLQAYAIDLLTRDIVSLAREVGDDTPQGKVIALVADWCEANKDETLIRTPFFISNIMGMLEERWRNMVFAGGLKLFRGMVRLDSALPQGEIRVHPKDLANEGISLPMPLHEVVMHRAPEKSPKDARTVKLYPDSRVSRGSITINPIDGMDMAADGDGDHNDIMLSELAILPGWAQELCEWHRTIQGPNSGSKDRSSNKVKVNNLQEALILTLSGQVGTAARAENREATLWWMNGCKPLPLQGARVAKIDAEIQAGVDATKHQTVVDDEFLEHHRAWCMGAGKKPLICQEWDKLYFPEAADVLVGEPLVFAPKMSYKDIAWTRLANQRIWSPRRDGSFRQDSLPGLVSGAHWFGRALLGLGMALPKIRLAAIDANAVRGWIPDGSNMWADEIQSTYDNLIERQEPLILAQQKLNRAIVLLEDHPKDELPEALQRFEGEKPWTLKQYTDAADAVGEAIGELHDIAQKSYRSILDGALSEDSTEAWKIAVGRLWFLHHNSPRSHATDMWLAAMEDVCWRLCDQHDAIYARAASQPLHSFTVVTPRANWNRGSGEWVVTLHRRVRPKGRTLSQYLDIQGSEDSLMVGETDLCKCAEGSTFRVRSTRAVSERSFVVMVVPDKPEEVADRSYLDDGDEGDLLVVAKQMVQEEPAPPPDDRPLSERLKSAGWTLDRKGEWHVAASPTGYVVATKDGKSWFRNDGGKLVEARTPRP